MKAAATALMRSETRVVRPYKGLSVLEEKFRSVELMLGTQTFEGGPGSIVVSREDLAEGQVVLSLNMDRAALEDALGIAHVDSSSVKLLVTAKSITMNIFEIILKEPLEQINIFEPFVLDKDKYPLIFGDINGFDVRVAVILTTDVPSAPALAPKRMGTWLAKQEFKLRTESLDTGFNPKPVTDEELQGMGAPKGCMSWLDVGDDILECELLANSVSHYVNSDLYQLVVADRKSPASMQIQVQWAIEVLSGIVQAVHGELARGASAMPNSGPLFDYLTKLAREMDLTVEVMISEAGSQTILFQARLGSVLGILARTKDLFGGE